MRRVDSLEKTLMLGGIGGKRRRGQQRMRWLDGIIDSRFMGMHRVRHDWSDLVVVLVVVMWLEVCDWRNLLSLIHVRLRIWGNVCFSLVNDTKWETSYHDFYTFYIESSYIQISYISFFKFYFIFKLYNIVLVLPNIKIDPPQVYMCSPSWTLLPPPSLYHPSRSSLCTSPKHPVSCIEPGLVTRFIHDIVHVSMPFSQIFPPSPSPTGR